MKKIFYAIVAAILFLGSTSCSKEVKEQSESSPSQDAIEVETIASEAVNPGTIALVSPSQDAIEVETKAPKTVNPETIAQVKAELATWREHLPIEGGVGMIITAMEFDDATNTIKYRYQYTVPGVVRPTEAQKNEAKETAIAITKTTPKEKKLLEEGITFRYDYYSVDDEYLYTMSITPEDMAE